MNRRKYLAAGLTLGVATIAGCSGDDGEPADENESDGDEPADGDEPSDGDGTDDGTDGYTGTGTEHYAGTWSGENASGTWEFTVDWDTGEITGSTSGDVIADVSGSVSEGDISAEGDAAMGTVTWTGSFSADGSSVSGEWSGLGDSGTWSGEPAPDEGTDSEDGTDGDSTDGEDSTDGTDGTDGETTAFGEIYTLESNYVAEIEFEGSTAAGSGTATVKYYDSDSYQRIEPDSSDDVFEIYHVDGDTYVVLDETECYLNPGDTYTPDVDAESEGDAESYGTIPEPDLEPSGTTEIDGETAHVFVVTDPTTGDEVTLYVSAESGYLLRVEWEMGTIDFHSWGDVDPITPPDMECVSF